MKKILFFLMISQLCFSQVFETVPIMENGPRDKRINMVVLGDGFTAAEQEMCIRDSHRIAKPLEVHTLSKIVNMA